MTRHFLLLGFSVFFGLFGSCHQLFAQEPVTRLEVSLNLVDPFPDPKLVQNTGIEKLPEFLRGRYEFPEPLPSGKAYELNLKVLNTSKRDFVFNKVESSCACGSAKFKLGELGSGKVADGIIKFRVQGHNQSNRIQFFFSNEGKHVGEIELVFEVAGHLGFETGWQQLTFEGEIGEWQFPGTFSSPIEFGKLEVVKSDSFADLLVKLEKGKTDGTFVATLSAAKSVFDGNALHGSFGVRQAGEKETMAAIQVSIRRTLPVVITPESLFFRPDPDYREMFIASALVRFRPLSNSEHTEPSSLKTEVLQELTATFRENQVDVQAKEIAVGIYRLAVRMPKQTTGPEPDDLKWVIRTDRQSFTLNTPFTFAGDH